MCSRRKSRLHGKNKLKNGWELLVVCDGMGGHSGGYEASRLAVRSMISFFEQNCGIHDPKDFIQQTILHANTKVFKTAQDDGSLKGMGTTVTLLLKEVILLGMAMLVIAVYTSFEVKNLFYSRLITLLSIDGL